MTDDDQSYPELERFRREDLAPERLAAELTATPRRKLVLKASAGVGKSFAITNLIVHLLIDRKMRRVVYLADQRRVLDETIKRLRKCLPRKAWDSAIVLERRPGKRCGDLDQEWLRYERAGCGPLGRMRLCEQRCPRFDGCTWPHQSDPDRLKKVRLILGVIDYLPIYPELRRPNGGGTLVLIIDDLRPSTPRKKHITRSALETSLKVVKRLQRSRGLRKDDAAVLITWELAHRCILDDRDLDDFPMLKLGSPDLRSRYQSIGLDEQPVTFRNILHDLMRIARGARAWFDDDGGVTFLDFPPIHSYATLVATTTMSAPLVNASLGVSGFEELYPGVQFMHPSTEFINLHFKGGVMKYAKGNGPRILTAFSKLAARDLCKGRRVLFVTRHALVQHYQTGLKQLLSRFMRRPIEVFIAGPKTRRVPDAVEVAIVHYGLTGTNAFEAFQRCYCLTTFNVPERAVAQVLHDLIPGDVPDAHDISIEYRGDRGDRVVRLVNGDPRGQALVEAIYHHVQRDVVLQAVGRCRYVSRPRMVVTMQQEDLGVPLTKEIHSLAELRRLFRIRKARRSVVLRAHAGGAEVTVLTGRRVDKRLLKPFRY